MPDRRTTTKDVALLRQLYDDGQLELAAEFQRNSVWPRAAKAYLLDTIVENRPIPQLFLQRYTSAQTGRPSYKVIDGQQRLTAVFEFIDNRFGLTQTTNSSLKGQKFSQLPERLRSRILSYDFVVEELSGYSDSDVRDLFVRMNKYVVRLSPQELRHAREEGAFYDFVERLGRWDIWQEARIFTPTQLKRMRAVEFSGELAILLIEGPQDKKAALDLYYGLYQLRFPGGRKAEQRLKRYLNWIQEALPDFSESRFRKPVDLYALIGALDRLASSTGVLSVDWDVAGKKLQEFERLLNRKRPPRMASRYLLAASRQTDNIRPRLTRINTLVHVVDSD
ncbi:MAG TPA: DUF262 domain-containing protein [Solirubrobacterales bacterium]|nr:DUF262 domain-containing protein [Solirubrobacterales bacterium]